MRREFLAGVSIVCAIFAAFSLTNVFEYTGADRWLLVFSTVVDTIAAVGFMVQATKKGRP